MSYFEATDGTTLYYREYGDGRPIVLLASQGLSSSMWQHLMIRLADQGFRCVALDRRGHGRSDDPGKGYDFDRFARLRRLAGDDPAGHERHAANVAASLAATRRTGSSRPISRRSRATSWNSRPPP